MQPEFTAPEFINHNSAEEIYERMMNNLPDDIDDMPGGFPFDFTKPAALENAEFINYHLVRAIMIAFPMYAWDEWLDLHGRQVHVYRHKAIRASGRIEVKGQAGYTIPAGTVFCAPATNEEAAVEYVTDEEAKIGESGVVLIAVTAVLVGTGSNVQANVVSIMAKPVKEIVSVTNLEPITGGTEQEENDAYYDRIAAEYKNTMTYLGNDVDYIRWAKEAGAGDCIVISAYDGPGTVKLVLVDENGQPANQRLVQAVYNYIVSPDDRSKRLLPTACAKLECVTATTVSISYTCTGLIFDDRANMEQIKKDFSEAVKHVYDNAKTEGILRYNDVRPLISAVSGVEDFDTFLINGGMANIKLEKEEYPETGTLDFTQEAADEEI